MASDAAKTRLTAVRERGATEQIVYRPSGGLPREITAIVDRRARQEVMGAALLGIQATVLNDVVYGIACAVLDVGADRLDIADKHGGTRRERGIQRLIDADDDWVEIEAV